MKNTIGYKEILDEIQKIVHADLKIKGFNKKGRTHNREGKKGIIQVINFQMDKYPIGPNYAIPGLRESLWGKFTVNLGVYIEELYTAFHDQNKKIFAQEYNCEIRTRLSHLTIQKDEWYPLDNKYSEVANKIIIALNREGQQWFDRFNSREKIVADCREKQEIEFSPREKLNAAIIQLGIDREDGENIFKDYFYAIDDSIQIGKGHKAYVLELAKKLGINLK